VVQVVDGEVERRVIVRVLQRHISLALQQQLNSLRVPAQTRVVHRRVLQQQDPEPVIATSSY